MKRWMTVIAAAGLIAGCSSTPPKEQSGAQVEDRQAVTPPKPEASKPPTATTKPLDSDRVSARDNPLKDPSNILSRRSIYFDYDSNVVKDEFKPLVSAHAKYLADHRSDKVTIQGNTDERGSREYNIA